MVTKNNTLKCPKCGHSKVVVEGNPKSAKTAACASCGCAINLGHLKSVAKKKNQKTVKADFEKKLKKRLGKRFKTR